MKKSACAMALLLCMSLLLTGCNESESPKKTNPIAMSLSVGIQLDPGWKKIKQEEGDLYGDKTPERITLAARGNEYKQQDHWQIWINEQKVLELDNQQGYYEFANISLNNIDNDAYDELLIFRTNGGSGAGSGLCIYKIGSNGLNTMLETDPGFEDQKDFEVKYIGEYRVSFKSPKTGFDAVIDLNPKNYQGMENELSKINTWVDPIAEYQIEDLDKDGKKEVAGIRRVIGISHPDTIASLKIIYKLQGSKFADEPQSYILTDADGIVVGSKQQSSFAGENQ